MLIYPLEWPVGWTRSRTHAAARFGSSGRGATLSSARERLLVELERLKATQIQISTNVRTYTDGTWRLREPEPGDHGAAVYFRIGDQARALACDKWLRVADNVHALYLHVEAIRGQLRWGVGSVDQAFGGYKALPAMGARKVWYQVLGVSPAATAEEIKRARNAILSKVHPDVPGGGDAATAAEVTEASNEALRLLHAETFDP